MPRKLDLTGRVFHWLTVQESTRLNNRTAWWCVCRCGVRKKVDTGALMNGHRDPSRGTLSCGCWSRVQAHKNGKLRKTHGMRYTDTYRSWVAMHSRCNPNSKFYTKWYRGISVHKRWDRFENFLEDMGARPNRKYSLDRINNLLGYSKSNCRWVTRTTQSQNRRNTLWLTYKGKTLNAAEWARILGGTTGMIHSRVRRGWSLERVLTQAKRKNIACNL